MSTPSRAPPAVGATPSRRLGLDHKRLTDVAGEVVKRLLA